MKLKPKTAEQIILPGIYEWVNGDYIGVGMIYPCSGMRAYAGAFTDDRGAMRSVYLPLNEPRSHIEGSFYGPIPSVVPSEKKK